MLVDAPQLRHVGRDQMQFAGDSADGTRPFNLDRRFPGSATSRSVDTCPLLPVTATSSAVLNWSVLPAL